MQKYDSEIELEYFMHGYKMEMEHMKSLFKLELNCMKTIFDTELEYFKRLFELEITILNNKSKNIDNCCSIPIPEFTIKGKDDNLGDCDDVNMLYQREKAEQYARIFTPENLFRLDELMASDYRTCQRREYYTEKTKISTYTYRDSTFLFNDVHRILSIAYNHDTQKWSFCGGTVFPPTDFP
jgi:hypothetical protein